MNSRLRIILDELESAAGAIGAAGGNTLIIAGDINHVRGSLDPEVLNPLQDSIRRILDSGVNIYFIPGNHDLAGEETTMLGSTAQTLSETFSSEGTITAINTSRLVKSGDSHFAFVPWCSTTEKLLAEIQKLSEKALLDGTLAKTDLIIHAGIDGVLDHMPSRGLTAARLATFGFRYVFAGHYHNHKDLGSGVYSIGATTHQSWSDVGALAGWILVGEDAEVVHVSSCAPAFVDVSELDEELTKEVCKGNYIRYRGMEMTSAELKEKRQLFVDNGALGVSIQAPKKAAATRTTTPTSSGMSIDKSVAKYVDEWKEIPTHVSRDEVKKLCLEILASTLAVHEEA
ncbi:DNA repair exonuclease SbcCD nuclease subunit [Phyllobacterium myrsinacearum]|uniref:DNA repair exonuclease SbcCD nuclease subunit n=1 Tax=Phyllobacterium myrsinacearum TaxID=28101 RepID=A0A839EW88_9HYPH|nr:DNA repair exonuclease SbcCD nuclease subunit [Phyllobacterium myrsinacearum]